MLKLLRAKKSAPAKDATSRGERPLQVLIAHQSTIPAYRVAFYELLEQMRPDWWEFKVVYNGQAHNASPSARQAFQFPVVHAPLKTVPFSSGKLKWQNFLNEASRADVLVLDTLLSNLTYPLSVLLQGADKCLVFWGHSSDRNVSNPGLVKQLAESVKANYLTRCNGFFAYTDDEAARAVQLGLDPKAVTVLNNTIDIAAHRTVFEKLKSNRDRYRKQLGFNPSTKAVLLVGRLIKERRMDFLLAAFRAMDKTADTRLIIVGDGPESYRVKALQKRLGPEKVVLIGNVTDIARKAELYLASDLFVMPGAVGLAPIEALCYDLPMIYFDLVTHGPEVIYLVPQNSVRLHGNTTPEEFAAFLKQSSFPRFDESRYQSIEHLTLQNMVNRFITGMDKLLTDRQANVPSPGAHFR